jgi:thiamine-phosphate pyrophosphorylase
MTRGFAFPSPLYAILDAAQCRERSLDGVLKDLLRGGGRVVQLRLKEASGAEFLELAEKAGRHAASAGCLLFVNDRVDIALAAGADGVHLGQDDLPLTAARRLIGERIIGISTHTPSQARDAEEGGADYIGFGPMFGTNTKETGYSPRGLEMLRAVRREVKLPIVAIGGITEGNATEVLRAGADAVAMISGLMGAQDVAATVRRVLALAQTSSASSAS